MKRRTLLVGSAAVLSGTGLVTGSQGFSRTSAQRETTIRVEDDESGYLRLQYNAEPDPFGCEDTEFTFIEEIGNQTTATLTSVLVEIKSVPDTITVSKDGNTIDTGDIITVLEAPSSDHGDALGVGESVSVDLTVTCDDGVTASEAIEFDVEIEGDDTSIETERPEAVNIDCGCETTLSVTGVKYDGLGTLTVETPTDTEAGFTVWFFENGTQKYENVHLETNKNVNIRTKVDDITSEPVVAIGVPDEPTWYRHPNFSPDDCEVTRANPGGQGIEEEINEC